jgi:hypothetical protein
VPTNTSFMVPVPDASTDQNLVEMASVELVVQTFTLSVGGCTSLGFRVRVQGGYGLGFTLTLNPKP